MQVRNIMIPGLRGIEAGASLVQAAIQMKRNGVEWLPVCEDGSVIGVLSSRDFVVRGVADGADPVQTEVRQIMTAPPSHCREGNNVVSAAETMKSHKICQLLVVNREGRVAGLVSLSQIAAETGNQSLAGEALGEVCRDA